MLVEDALLFMSEVLLLLESDALLLLMSEEGLGELLVAGGVGDALGVCVLGFDWAIAPDSANALSATPAISFFSIWASKLFGSL